jgi:hypothetical protein
MINLDVSVAAESMDVIIYSNSKWQIATCTKVPNLPYLHTHSGKPHPALQAQS